MTTDGPPVGGRPSRVRHPAIGAALALFLILAGALAVLPRPASGASEVLREVYAPDAWDTSFANVWVNQKVAQSFVARTSFLLTHVDLYVFDQPESNPPDILQVHIAADAGNRPGAFLASTARQGQRNWTWVPFSYFPWLPLTSGQRYWIVAEDGEPRPKGYEWAMNRPGGYAAGEAQWYDASSGTWTRNTGADLFFKVFGISGPALVVDAEPNLRPVNPGAVVPIDVYFNNTGNEAAGTARIDVDLSRGLRYVADDAALEGGVPIEPLAWSFQNVAPGSHRMTAWVEVVPDAGYFDGQSLHAWAFLNYTDSGGTPQAGSSDKATLSILVPVIRIEAVPSPRHVAPGDAFNFTVSFFNVGSGTAAVLWLNATPGARVTILGDDAGSAGGIPNGPGRWRFDNVTAQVYLFNVTVRADPGAWPGDRLTLRLNATYTDGARHVFASRATVGQASIHGPSLVVEAATPSPSVRPSNPLPVTLYVNNTGDEVASRVWLNVTLPAQAGIEASTPSPTAGGPEWLRYEMTAVGPGPRSVALTLRVSDVAAPATRLDVVASVDVANATGAMLRPSSATASSSVSTPRLTLRLESSGGLVAPGDTIDLVLRWNNSGNEAARRVWLNFTLPGKTLLVNSTMPWTFTNGTTYGWQFANLGPGEGAIGVRLEVSARVTDGEALAGAASLRWERGDGALLDAQGATVSFTAALPAGLPDGGWAILFLWLAILVAIFLLFLLLAYLDVLPRRRATIDDVFLLHNSGILICHYSTTLRPDVDSDIASGMLMAVRNFVADALRSKNGSLQELKYGDHRIHMVHGVHSILVVFARGRNGRVLEMRMREVLRDVETAYASVLEAWSGRTEDFKGVEEYLLRLVNA